MSDHPSEAGHWYDREGRPAYSIVGANGKERPTTLRDARANLWCPSVTTIIRCAAAPGLEAWKRDQTLLAALTLPRRDDEAEADWLARVRLDSDEQGRAAAGRGTEIHARIEAYYGGEGVRATDPLATVIEVVASALFDRFGDLQWATEQSFAHPLGFGGKADAFCGYSYPLPILLDFKTKDNWPENYPPKGFDEQLLQLAAYRVGLGREQATCANVFCSRQEPWQVHVHEWSEDELQRGWTMFQALLDFWKAKSGFDPSWRPEEEQLDAIAF